MQLLPSPVDKSKFYVVEHSGTIQLVTVDPADPNKKVLNVQPFLSVKDDTNLIYESGMNAIGTARKRFNVRFYMIAMVFLVFDIEIIFLYPWAVTFPNLEHGSTNSLIWLARILFFVFTTIVAYVYGVRKGVFRFE